ncbi:MAG: hypothetical protein K2M97_02100 [Muribaculaceae bacterium]|nr:hypothetical protein [Muribaculaceae bacterium]
MKPKFIIAMAVAAASLAGCKSEESPNRYVGLSFVTYEGTTPDSRSIFTLQKVNDAPEMELRARWMPPEWLKPGRRLVIQYSMDALPEASVVNDVDLLTCTLPFGDTIRFMADSAVWSSEPLFVNSIWRSGHYINLDCMMRPTTVDGEGSLELVADSISSTTSHPVLFLTASGQRTGSPYVYTVYGSWNIDTLWSRPDVEAVTVRADNANLNVNSFTFTK